MSDDYSSSDDEYDEYVDPELCGLRLEIIPSLRKTFYKLHPINDALLMSVEDEEAALQKAKEEGEKKRLQIISERDKLIEKIPGFWAKFENHSISTYFTEDDWVIAKSILSMKVKTSLTSFEVTIKLSKNSVIENTELHKFFREREDGTDTAGCTKIKWIKKAEEFKKKNKKNKKMMPKKKRKEGVSIFSWFGAMHSELNNDFIIDTLADIYEEAYTLFTLN